MLTRSECKSSAEVIQFLTIFPNASCLPTPSSEFMNSVKPNNNNNQQTKTNQSNNSQGTNHGNNNNNGDSVENNQNGQSDVNNNNTELTLDTSASAAMLNTSTSTNSSNTNNSNNNNNDNTNKSGLVETTKTNNNRIKIQLELDLGYGYKWYTYNNKHNVLNLNNFKEPNDQILNLEKNGKINLYQVKHYLFNMSDYSCRTLYREGLKCYECWNLKSKTVENIMQLNWFVDNRTTNDNNNNDVEIYDQQTCSLACFWLDFHYCVFLHQHKVNHQSYYILTNM